MHSFLLRLNAVLCHAVLIAAILAFGNVLTTFWLPSSPQVSFQVHTLQTFTRSPSGLDGARVVFDIDADLRSLFNWNTKQVFAYVVAEYSTEKNEVNQVVIWDVIIQTKEQAHIQRKNENVEYALVDQGEGLKNNNVTFRFGWDVTPITGLLQKTSVEPTTVTFPAQYISRPYTFS